MTISPNGATIEEPFIVSVSITRCNCWDACKALDPPGSVYHSITVNGTIVLYGDAGSVSLDFHDGCCYASGASTGPFPPNPVICSCDGIYEVRAVCGCQPVGASSFGIERRGMDIYVTNHVYEYGYCEPEPPGPNPEPCASIQ